MIDLNNKEILQLNSALIAGALVFLTISSLSFPTYQEKESRGISIIYGAGIIIAFGLSSIYAIYEKTDRSLRFTRLGFMFLVFRAVIFFVVTDYDVYFGASHSETSMTNQSK